MEQVYIGYTLLDNICAFTKVDDEVRIYTPNNFLENYRTAEFGKWLEQAQSYPEPNDLDQYDDIVNAAWQNSGYNDPLNKKSVEILKMPGGRFYPRVWRGLYKPEKAFYYNPIEPRLIYGSVYIRSNVAVSSLYDYLQDLFRYVEPDKSNLDVFGNKIRELLILTCTEVESGWRSVLEDNSSTKKDRYSTNDYIRIMKPLRLDEWSVELRDYPDLGIFSPFQGWSKVESTKSLPWYHGYNAVKHHRAAEFSRSNLRNLINAVAAIHILQVSQWGPGIYDQMFDNLSSPFFTTRGPSIALTDLYVPTLDEKKMLSPIKYFDHQPP